MANSARATRVPVVGDDELGEDLDNLRREIGLRSTPGWRRVELTAIDRSSRVHQMHHATRILRAAGFAVVRASQVSSPGVLERLRERHLAVLLGDDDAPEDVERWLRIPNPSSPRGHVICYLGRPRRRAACGLVREGSTVYAVRRGCLLSGQDALETARAAEARLAAGDIRAAEHLVTTGLALAFARGEVASATLVLLDVQTCFWKGQFGAARDRLETVAPSPDRLGWEGLLCWAVFDGPGLVRRARACRRWAMRGDERAAFWDAVLSRIGRRWSFGRTAPRRWLKRAPPALQTVATFASVEHAIARGHGRLVRRWCSERAAKAAPSGLLTLASRWVLAQPEAADEKARIRGELLRRGVPGVMRWAQGRERMRILHFVPGLLQVVSDAEDERLALASACRWIRAHAGARGVAIVAGRDGRVVAHDGWSRTGPDACGLVGLCRETLHVVREPDPRQGFVRVAAPVRYGGAIIGHVVGRSSSEEASTVEDGVQALAALCGPALRASLDASDPPDDPSALMPELIGRSPAMVAVRDAVRQAARTAFPVLIEGESGTGKELVARALHRLSDRRTRRFMAVNCAAFTDDLVEAELFGFARGAFTGALTPRAGLVEEASGGSLFLDEVSELSPRAQAKLLRVLQEREVRRVGENATRPVDVRVLAATNRPIAEAAREGHFREDLMFRLAVVRITLPPLRDRVEDLPALASVFWRQSMADVGKRVRLTSDVVGAFCRYRWPGNVRELQNVIAAMAVRAPARGRVPARQVRLHLAGGSVAEASGLSLDEIRRQCERRAVASALARHGGRRTAAARELGLTRQGLSKAIRRLGLHTGSDQAGVA